MLVQVTKAMQDDLYIQVKLLVFPLSFQAQLGVVSSIGGP